MTVSLTSWRSSDWLQPHQTSPEEISGLLDPADRDLSDCETAGLSPDWQLNIAHNAALLCATAALAACGYRASREAHHYRTMLSLKYTIKLDRPVVARLDKLRKKRNISGYERPGTVSEQEAEEMIRLARRIRKAVQKWLESNHPDLVA